MDTGSEEEDPSQTSGGAGMDTTKGGPKQAGAMATTEAPDTTAGSRRKLGPHNRETTHEGCTGELQPGFPDQNVMRHAFRDGAVEMHKAQARGVKEGTSKRGQGQGRMVDCRAGQNHPDGQEAPGAGH